jgi:hypothetical protein
MGMPNKGTIAERIDEVVANIASDIASIFSLGKIVLDNTDEERIKLLMHFEQVGLVRSHVAARTVTFIRL